MFTTNLLFYRLVGHTSVQEPLKDFITNGNSILTGLPDHRQSPYECMLKNASRRGYYYILHVFSGVTFVLGFERTWNLIMQVIYTGVHRRSDLCNKFTN